MSLPAIVTQVLTDLAIAEGTKLVQNLPEIAFKLLTNRPISEAELDAWQVRAKRLRMQAKKESQHDQNS